MKASSLEATTSLGSRIRKIMRLSGVASESSSAPNEPLGSLMTRYWSLLRFGYLAAAPSKTKLLMDLSHVFR